MPLWDDIDIEISNGNVPPQFRVGDLMFRQSAEGYSLGNGVYSEHTIKTQPANYRSNPPGALVKKGAIARFERVSHGVYQLIRRANCAGVRVANSATTSDRQIDMHGENEHMKDSRKTQFLSCASDFIDWMVISLNEFPNDYVHCWRAIGDPTKSGLQRGAKWACTSLYSAFQQYSWPGKVENRGFHGRIYSDNNDCLSRIKEDLVKALDNQNGQEARKYCNEILEWGGVSSKPRVAPHIKHSIADDELPAHLNETKDYLKGCLDGTTDSSNGYCDSNRHKLAVDSGTTKIYSLICDGFVMYDGRVASALAYLVRLWWEGCLEKNQRAVYGDLPNCLKFSYDSNKKHNKIKVRNPNPIVQSGKPINVFPPLKNGPKRTEENVRASWLLADILERDRKKQPNKGSFFSELEPVEALRALEAAIFMVGYIVNQSQLVKIATWRGSSGSIGKK